ESGWNKYRGQHERDRDDRSAHLFHRLQGGLAWRKTMFDVMFDRLDNHDGVIDDKTNRQHETKERERVHGESEHWKQRERAHQGNWNSEQRDQSCAPALQENENDHDDEKE